MTPQLRSSVCTAALIAAAATVALAQQGGVRDTPQRPTPAGAASISGVVVLDGATPAVPIRRAIVTLTGTGITTSLQVLTNDEGRFAFPGLVTGRFSLTAEKPAYVKTYYGSTRPGRPPGTPITLGEGQQLTGISIPLI